MSSITMHLIGEDEIPVLQNYAPKAYYPTYSDFWYDGGTWYVSEIYKTETIKREISAPLSHYLLAKEEGEIVGFLKVNIHKPLIINNEVVEEQAVELQRIYTHLSGKGIGQYLMDFSIELAVKNHSKLIWLQVMDTSTQAIRFYEKNGFKICGAHTLSYEKMKPQLRGMFTMKRML